MASKSLMRGSESGTRRVWIGWVLAALAALPASCASTVGAIVGPVTGPVTYIRHTEGIPPWAMPLVFPMAVVIGPAFGFIQGARSDLGLMFHGAYGVDGDPPFGIVFDPASPEYSTPAKQFGYAQRSQRLQR